jgi:hypothetical protein
MEHVVGANVAEIIRVVARLEDVVVALDEHLIPVEAPQNGKRSPVYNHISEVIDLVLGADNVVPVFDKDLVHFFDVIPGSHLGAVLVEEFAHPGVAEVGVAD